MLGVMCRQSDLLRAVKVVAEFYLYYNSVAISFYNSCCALLLSLSLSPLLSPFSLSLSLSLSLWHRKSSVKLVLMTVLKSRDERVWALCITCGVGWRGCRGENNKSRAVGGASWLRVGRQVGEVYAMYAKQLMRV